MDSRIDVLEKSRLRVSLAFDGRDVEYPVMGEPYAVMLKRMAVGLVHRTVRSEPEMDDATILGRDGLEGLVKLLKIESFVVFAGGGDKATSMGMADAGGFQFIVFGHLLARALDYDNTHGNVVLRIVV